MMGEDGAKTWEPAKKTKTFDINKWLAGIFKWHGRQGKKMNKDGPSKDNVLIRLLKTAVKKVATGLIKAVGVILAKMSGRSAREFLTTMNNIEMGQDPQREVERFMGKETMQSRTTGIEKNPQRTENLRREHKALELDSMKNKDVLGFVEAQKRSFDNYALQIEQKGTPADKEQLANLKSERTGIHTTIDSKKMEITGNPEKSVSETVKTQLNQLSNITEKLGDVVRRISEVERETTRTITTVMGLGGQ